MVVYKISSNLEVLESPNETSWKKSSKKFDDAIFISNLFKENNNFNHLLDEKENKFLKGKFDKKPLGKRITMLPNGKELTKAYSLFSPNLHLHDESSHGHWDLMFQNPNGSFCYIYTKEKEIKNKNKKYKRVILFEKVLPKLTENLEKNLSRDPLVLPMIILLKTKIRVGSLQYYSKNGHRGLLTLKKKDVLIKENKVTFEFLSKDGVPQKITKDFSLKEIKLLKKLLSKKKKEDFLFTNKNKKTYTDKDFEKAFEKYSGEKFYPHIVRSHFATKKIQSFFNENKNPSKKDAKDICIKIAQELGHKKYSKKKQDWQESYAITLHYYVEPRLAEKIMKILKKK